MNNELSTEAKGLLSLATSDGDVSPNDADRSRVRKRVGIALAASSAAGVAVSAGSASAAAGGLAGTILSGGLGLKAMAVVALVSGVVGVGVLSISSPEVSAVTRTSAEPAQVPQGAREVVEPGSPASSPAIPAIAVPSNEEMLAAEPSAELLAPDPEASATTRPRRAPATRSAPTAIEEDVSTMSLSDELTLLQAAQQARVQGNFDEALRQLDEHRRRFPAGRLAAERDGTRVFVLCDASRPAEAARAQSDFLRDHATSPLAHRVRNGCD